MSDTVPILQAETAIMFVQHSITIPLTHGMQVGLQFATVVYTQNKPVQGCSQLAIQNHEYGVPTTISAPMIINVSTTVL